MSRPWTDLEHFPRHDFHPQALSEMVCEIQAKLHAQGQRLHSMDVAPWGSYGFFNVSELYQPTAVAFNILCG